MNKEPFPVSNQFVNRLNSYTCSEGHVIITIDRDEGTTPMLMECKHPNCGKQSTSSFYNVPQGSVPTYEWYKPDLSNVKGFEMDHVLRGGLLIRKIDESKVDESRLGVNENKKTPSDSEMREMARFTSSFKAKNPNASDREFRRAFKKRLNDFLLQA